MTNKRPTEMKIESHSVSAPFLTRQNCLLNLKQKTASAFFINATCSPISQYTWSCVDEAKRDLLSLNIDLINFDAFRVEFRTHTHELKNYTRINIIVPRHDFHFVVIRNGGNQNPWIFCNAVRILEHISTIFFSIIALYAWILDAFTRFCVWVWYGVEFASIKEKLVKRCVP